MAVSAALMAVKVLYRTGASLDVWPKTSRLSLKQTRDLHSRLSGACVSVCVSCQELAACSGVCLFLVVVSILRFLP